VDVITFTEWLLELLEASPAPEIRDVQAVPNREVITAIEVTVPGPGNPSIDKIFRIRVDEA
jgi:hypothetical protein